MKDTQNSTVNRQNLVRVVGTIVALALLVYLLSHQGWHEIVAAFRQIAPWRLAAAMALMILSRLMVSVRWIILLRSGGINVTNRQGLRINFAGLFANNFLPTTVGGDVVRLAGALQLHFDAAVSTASLVVDRLVGMTGMVITVPFGLAPVLQSLTQQSSLLSGISRHISSAAIPFFGKWGMQAREKGAKAIRSLLGALTLWWKQPRALFLGLVYTWIHMFCLFGVLYLLFQGMGQDIPFMLIAGLYSLVYFVTLMPFSVNGYGLQELSMTLVFSTFGGATVGSGIAAALLFRTLMMLASLPGVLFIPEMLAEIRLRRSNAG